VALVYAKGALFFHALRQQIGEEAFNRFLRSYYTTYRYDEATGMDMLNQAQIACECDLQPLYRDWITTVAPVTVP
jgi:aminopeptidase N